MTVGSEENPPANGGYQKVFVIAAVLILASGSFFLLKSQNIDLDQLQKVVEAWVTDAGPAGPLVFAACYSVAAVLLIPASVLTLLAGYLFGPLKGTLTVSIAATSGATLAFLLARYALRPLVEERLAKQPRFAAIDSAIGREGAKIVLLLRLSPLVPYGLLNYFLGVSKVELGPYVLATWAGMLPGGFAYVYLGGVGKETLQAAGGGGMDTSKLVLYGIGAAATIYATKVISTQAKKALDESEASNI